MATYLLTWNPDAWTWTDLDEDLAKIKENGFFEGTWSCGLTKSIQVDDRVFLLRQGKEPRGIIASGHATSTYYVDTHWDSEKAALGVTAQYIRVRFDQLFDPFDQIIPRSQLDIGVLASMHWDSQMSGTRIPSDVASELELEWQELARQLPTADEFEPYAVEGLVTETIRYNRGRSGALKKQALEMANGVCAACGTDFKKVLKGKGVRVLQVHHVEQLASTDTPRLTRLSDLAVVCANCHMLIHSNPTIAIPVEKLKLSIKQSRLEP
jgi:predicted HNH restriction endonuclease